MEDAAVKIQRWFRNFLNKNSDSQNLAWDHSPQNVHSEADVLWSEQLQPRKPEDFVRLFTDEIVEDALENIDKDNRSDNETNDEDDVFTPPTCRLKRRGAFRRKISPPIEVRLKNPVLPETVNLSRVQNLDDVLSLTAPLLPELVDPGRAQHLDLALAELGELDHRAREHSQERFNQEELPEKNNHLSPEPRRSLRLRKENPKFVGIQWDNNCKEKER